MSDELAAYDLGWEWFTLGDLDLATHLARTELLRAGHPLSEVTARLARTVAARRHAAADDRRRGRDPRGARRRTRDPLRGVVGPAPRRDARRAGFVQTNLATATPAPGVLDALRDADVVVIPPSNPVVSVGTILAIPGVRDALTTTSAPVVGVSPVVGGAPVRGMADACLTAIGVETTRPGRRRALRADAPTAGSSTPGWSTRSTPPRPRELQDAGWTVACGPHAHDRRAHDGAHRRGRARPRRPPPLTAPPRSAARPRAGPPPPGRPARPRPGAGVEPAGMSSRTWPSGLVQRPPTRRRTAGRPRPGR